MTANEQGRHVEGWIDRGSAIETMLAFVLEPIKSSVLSGAETALFAQTGPSERSRGGVYRGMTWDTPRGLKASFRMPAGGWPDWCHEPQLLQSDGPVVEVGLIYSHWPSSAGDQQDFGAAYRVLVVNEELGNSSMPRADLVVLTLEQDMDAVAEAFLRLLDRDVLIATAPSATAIYPSLGRSTTRVRRHARAVCLDGSAYLPAQAHRVGAALNKLGVSTIGDGFCVMALVSPSDVQFFDCEEFAAFSKFLASDDRRRTPLCAVAHGASRSITVLIAFHKPVKGLQSTKSR